MRSKFSKLSILLLFLSFLYLPSCGGGGSSNTETANVTVTSNVDGAEVSILSYNKDGSKERDSVEGTALNNQFEKSVKMDKDGGYLVVNVTKDGYADWSKRVNFDKPHDMSINAVLSPVESQSIIPLNNNTVTISSTGQKVIKIALIKRSNGKKVIATGNQIRVMDGIPEFSMEIPRDSIPSEVKALKVGLSSFDPDKDADKFPGDYVDENGNRLISLGFNYISITDENGNPVFRENSPSATEATTYRITRLINDTVCDNLQGDFCTGSNDPEICSNLNSNELNGYNIPFYRYNNLTGAWELLGVGTIDIDNDGSIDSDDAVTQGFDAIQTCQDNYGFNTVIVITNPNFTYCNLDYPVVTPPTELCFTKIFKDQNGQPFTNVFAWLEDDDDNQSFLYSLGGYPDQTGTLILKTWNIANDGDIKAKLYYQYSKTIDNQSVIITKSEDITLGTDPNNCPTKTNTIDLTEKLCQVNGVVKYYDDTPAHDVWVNVTDENLLDTYVLTNNNGEFSATVPCNELLYVYTLLDYDEEYEEYEDGGRGPTQLFYYSIFKADGQINYDEVKDEAQPADSNYQYIVTLNDIPVPKPLYTLYVYKTGNGIVTSNPPGIYCGDYCYEDYEQGTTVTLTAQPDTGNYIYDWVGCDNVSPDKTTCTVSMNYYRLVTVVFKAYTQSTLNVLVTGNGSVVSNPLGINCQENAGSCTKSYDENTQVTLIANPNNGYTFNGWGSDCSSCGTNPSCTITMDANKICSAEFIQVQTPSVNITGVWEGSYTGNDGTTGQICVELQQTGNNLGGNLYIQGQGLVGSVTGTLSGYNIEFGIAAGVQYTGTVSNDGNSASGNYDENRDGNSDGTWQITRTDKESCGWITSDSDILNAVGFGYFSNIITEISTIEVNNNGTSETNWYGTVIEFIDNINGTNVPYVVAERKDNTYLLKAPYSSGTTTVTLEDKTQGILYLGTNSTNPISNASYGSTAIYDSGCVSSETGMIRAKLYKGTADIAIPNTTLQQVSPIGTNTRTIGIPSQNVTAYKLEVSNCP